MIQKTECYILDCDNCKEIYQNEHSGVSIFVDENTAWEDADNDGWICIRNRHYCPKCFTTDDNDKVKILKSRFKTHHQ